MDDDAAWQAYKSGALTGLGALLAGPVVALVVILALEESGVPSIWAERAGFAAALVVVGAGAFVALKRLWPVRGRGMGEMRATTVMATLCAFAPLGLAGVVWKSLF